MSYMLQTEMGTILAIGFISIIFIVYFLFNNEDGIAS